jgi:hypothetical protein
MEQRVDRFRRWWLLGVALALATAGARAQPANAAEEEWSREALAYVARSLAEVADRVEGRPPAAELAKLGLGAAHDAREMTGKSRTVHPNVGYLRPLDAGFRPVVARDPAIELSVRAALEARLGREVTDREVDAEIATSDAAIARLNAVRSAVARRHDRARRGERQR